MTAATCRTNGSTEWRSSSCDERSRPSTWSLVEALVCRGIERHKTCSRLPWRIGMVSDLLQACLRPGQAVTGTRESICKACGSTSLRSLLLHIRGTPYHPAEGQFDLVTQTTYDGTASVCESSPSPVHGSRHATDLLQPLPSVSGIYSLATTGISPEAHLARPTERRSTPTASRIAAIRPCSSLPDVCRQHV